MEIVLVSAIGAVSFAGENERNGAEKKQNGQRKRRKD